MLPTNPTRTDYTFDGWAVSTTANSRWNFATSTVNADLTLFARWIDEEKLLLTFTFLAADNPDMALEASDRRNITGSISKTTSYEVTTLEQSAYVYLEDLKVATFTVSPDATVTVGGVTQVSGTTENDFTQDVVYRVTSSEGLVMQTYTVKALTKSTYATIPDATFRAKLKELIPNAFNTEGNLEVTHSQVTWRTNLEVSKSTMATLKGIEFFTGLTTLSCFSNKLTTLDMTGMRTIDLLIINAGAGGTNPLTMLKVNEAVQQDDEIKKVKTDRGAAVTISTYNNDGMGQCTNYDPNADGGAGKYLN